MRAVNCPRPTDARSGLLRVPRDRRHVDELERLRCLFVEPEHARIERIEQTPASPEYIGGTLPEALAHAASKRSDELATAFSQPVTRALRDAVRRDSDLLGEILAPTIGVAVRRAVADAFAALVQRMNKLIERTFTLRSLSWRLEAHRKGRPFAEVVLAHTLVYQVEWVVLIHTETSLVLDQAAQPGSLTAPDQISAMLQALSSFVRDAFQPEPSAHLHTLEVGDLTVWIDRDPAITLAVAIRGTAPSALREKFRHTLVETRALCRSELATRSPDAAAVAGVVHPLVVDCLAHEYRPPRGRAKWVLAVLGLVAATLIGLLVVRSYSGAGKAADLRTAYAATLSTVPGIVVTSIERSAGGYRISGLRDPRAVPAEQIIARAGLPPAQLSLAAFDSLDPHFEEPLAAADVAIRELETIEVTFDQGSTSVRPADAPTIARVAELVNRTHRAAALAHLGLCVEIRGDSDDTGSLAINHALRPARAARVADALRTAGVATELLDARFVDAARSRPGRQVTFRVALRPPESPGCRP